MSADSALAGHITSRYISFETLCCPPLTPSQKTFIEGIEMLEDAGLRKDLKFNPFLDRLFIMLDTDKDGSAFGHQR